MEREAAAALYGALHDEAPFHDGSFTKWAKERGASHPYHYLDGVKFGVAKTDLAPHDKFTRFPGASPVESKSEDPGDGGVDAPLSAPGHDQPQDE
jgi:hypothetical protein